MTFIQETFIETDWDDENQARTARDARAEELQAQGLICTCENLYNVLGQRIFLVEAKEPEPIESRFPSKDKRFDKTRPSLRKPVNRIRPSFEER